MTIESSNPAFRYEGIVRLAFDCGKYDDPLGLAKQEAFSFENGEASFRLKLGLSYSLYKLGRSYDSELLEQLSEHVWASNSQTRIIEIMDEALAEIDQRDSK